MKAFYVEAQQFDVYENLAIEEFLLHYAENTECLILYLWQNQKAVIVGRNQNVLAECNTQYADKQGIKIARRMTGGGTVYHDAGNINYSIILPKTLYDIGRSTMLIVKSLERLGIGVSVSGRNDILLNGAKISGNAYYSNSFVGLHHGTILHSVDKDMMAKTLTVCDNKLDKHNIPSVQSRVTNINSFFPHITIDDIKQTLIISFRLEYDLNELSKLEVDIDKIRIYSEKYASRAWIYDRIREYKDSLTKSFGWGSLTMAINYKGEEIDDVELITDCLEIELINDIRENMLFYNKGKNANVNREKKKWQQNNVIENDIWMMFDELVNNRGVQNGKYSQNA